MWCTILALGGHSELSTVTVDTLEDPYPGAVARTLYVPGTSRRQYSPLAVVRTDFSMPSTWT